MRRFGAGVLVAILLAGVTVWFAAMPASATARQNPISMDVVDVAPNTPAITAAPKALSFTLSFTNFTDVEQHVVVTAVRSDPIGSRAQLDSALANPRPPSPDQVSPIKATIKEFTLGDHASVRRVLSTVTSDVFQTAHAHGGVCLCANAIYPFYFTATYTNADTSGSVTAQTYVPAFNTAPTKSTVTWVWPLLDRPHRLLHEGQFIDDALAAELGTAGRLFKLLDVIRRVSPVVPMTIVTDPDLIDEIVTMAAGYHVITPHGVVSGTGQAAATAWLATLKDVLATHQLVQVVFTPFADPAVDALSRAGQSWSASLDTVARARVNAALDGRTPLSDFAWPVTHSLSPQTLDTLVSQGANTVLVADRTLTGAGRNPGPNALFQTGTEHGPATLAVTSTPLQKLVAQVLNRYGNGLAVLPELVSQLAVQVVTATDTSHYVVLAPPRDLDVDVDVAVRAIDATADTTWARPLTVQQATGEPSPSVQTKLRTNARGPGLSGRLLRELDHVSTVLPPLTSLFQDAEVGAALSAPFPAAVQRCESSSLLTNRTAAFAMAHRLTHIVNSTRAAVSIIAPSDGTYTLTSKNSQLPITVVNRLNTGVGVRVAVDTVGGVPGLSVTDQNHTYLIDPNSKVQVHVPTQVDRVGVIRVVVRIKTTAGLVLGAPIRIEVRSTALGTIGVIITVVAAVVLALAVLVRALRRFRHRSAEKAAAPPAVP